MIKQYMKLNSITIKRVEKSYDFQVQNTHRIIAKSPNSENAFLTSNCVLSISHSDIKQFITAKQQSNRLSKFNLSVLVPDRFMNAVINNEMWDLCFPDTQWSKYKELWNGDLDEWIRLEYPVTVTQTMPARELWDLIIRSTYTRNEPGILFYDTLNDYNPVKYAETILTTNPCLSGDTLVAVADGRNAVTIKELAQKGEPFPVYSMGERVQICQGVAFKTKENAQLIKVVLDDGSFFKCTKDHRIMLRNKTYVQAKDLNPDDSLMPFNSYVSNKKYRQISSNIARDCRQYRMIAQYNNLIVDPKNTAIHHKNFNSYDDSIENLQPLSHEEHRILHSERMKGNNNPMRKWYPNASQQQKKRYHDNMSKSLSFQKNYRWLGKSDQDIKCFISELIKKYKRNISGKQYCEEAKKSGYPTFLSPNRIKRIGCTLTQLIKNITLQTNFQYYTPKQLQKIKLQNHKVSHIQECQSQDVYDITVPKNHNFGIITSFKDDKYIESSGVFVHNCGQIGMTSGVCNLGSLNLPRFYKDGSFDYQSFEQAIKYGVCFLDAVSDISFVPLDQYKQKIKDFRRIGLGVTGLGSLLSMLGIKFGSQRAIELVNQIFKFKCQIELLTSAILGKTKGSFLKFDKTEYFSSKWWYDLPISYQVKRQIQNIGCMRNSVHGTVPPSGNSSVFLGQVSNGIEPVFMQEYTRWVSMTQEQKEALGVQYPEPSAGEWFETDIFKATLRGNEQILRGTINGITYQIDKGRGMIKPMKVMDYGYRQIKQLGLSQEGLVDINQLSVQDHINMLATSAKYVNQNQSKTINIPQNYSYQQFKDVYMQAWRKKIKGVTTYRAGTMTAVLQDTKNIKTDTEQEEISQLEKLFKRTKENVILSDVKLPNKSYALQYKIKDKNKKKWYFTISCADKELTRPIAIFIRTNNKQSSEVTDMVINSMQKLLLDAEIREQLVVQQRKKYQGQSNIDKIGRAIGMALRHNIQISKIVQTLQQHNDGLSTLLFNIRKVLSGFIKDGTKIDNKKCQNCGETTLIYQGGCSTCSTCGHSKCS